MVALYKSNEYQDKVECFLLRGHLMTSTLPQLCLWDLRFLGFTLSKRWTEHSEEVKWISLLLLNQNGSVLVVGDRQSTGSDPVNGFYIYFYYDSQYEIQFTTWPSKHIKKKISYFRGWGPKIVLKNHKLVASRRFQKLLSLRFPEGMDVQYPRKGDVYFMVWKTRI